ncbi:MAG: mechanosensitive ion channel [Clostridiales bacterium]|nr:mechanosensitive ion channel [Clostridiales bacterium]
MHLILLEQSTEIAIIEEIEKNPGIVMTWLQSAAPTVLSFLVKVIIAVIVLIVGTRIIKALVKFIGRSMEKGHTEAGLASFLCSLIKYALYFLLIMVILSAFGVTTSSVVAVLGSAGLTLGLALQGSLSNFAGGVLILLLKPFVVGDYILDNDSSSEGTVTEISIFYTKLVTPDNKVIAIPNGSLSNTCIVNYSRMEKRRIDITVNVSYESNLSVAREALRSMILSDEDVLSDEPVDIFVSELCDSSVELGVRMWVATENFWPVKWRMTEGVKAALDAAGVTIPYPQMEVRMKQGAS